MNISVTDLSTSEDNKVVNVVGSISSKDIKNNIRKYVTADRLFRVAAFILRFISNLKLSVQRKEIKEIYLTTVEIEIAEYTWIKSVQKEFFKDKSNLKQFQIKLGVYLDTDSIYKCKGRLINSSLLEHSKAPIFLPKESYSSNPIILKEHQNLKLSGIKDTINQVRRSIYWIPKLRQFVRSILRKCILSRRFESKPYPNPPSAQLPEFRCQRSLPFQTTGVDYLGPLPVKPT